MDAVFYWDMTYKEIKTAIEGNQKKLRQDMQMQAVMTYKLGELIRIAFNDPKKYPSSPKKAFKNTGIFDDVNEMPTKQQDWQVMKARIEHYNSLRKKKRGESR